MRLAIVSVGLALLFSIPATVGAGEINADLRLGIGPALVLRDNDRGSDDTDLGVNLLAGAGFLRNQAIRPYFQVKLLISDDTEGVLAFGVRFF